MQNMEDFTHFNDQGRAKMVNVGEKDITERKATAGARVLVSRETFELIRTGGMKKGDVLTVAQIAGVLGAKQTPHIIPMCHPILINGVDLDLSLDEEPEINPSPGEIAEAMRRRYVSILLKDAMIVSEPDDTCLTVYDPDAETLRLLRTLAAGEGLYVWKPET